MNTILSTYLKATLFLCASIAAFSNVPTVQPAILSENTAELYSEYRCMFVALYHEARGESVQAQYLVASVVLNRVKHKNYPSDVCSVVNQRKQFSHISRTFQKLSEQPTAALNTLVDARVAKVAYKALYGFLVVPTAYVGTTHYHSKQVSPYWSSKMTKVATVGSHVFYR